jgi:hypothetical protein
LSNSNRKSLASGSSVGKIGSLAYPDPTKLPSVPRKAVKRIERIAKRVIEAAKLKNLHADERSGLHAIATTEGTEEVQRKD